MSRPQVLLVTGKLAEPALRRLLAELQPRLEVECRVAVLPITVIALATTPWIARHLPVVEGNERIILPGLCQGSLEVFAGVTGATVERGPADLRDLPEYFDRGTGPPQEYGNHDIEILAEINHAGRMSPEELLDRSLQAQRDGADLIDLGCTPGETWTGIGAAVRQLRDQGLRVSVDSFDPREVEEATAAGAELVLSVNRSNARRAASWGCEVVAIPDTPNDLASLDETVQQLDAAGVPFRLDPVLEPIGFGFAAALGRYIETRRRYPQAAMLMGVGNLTELTDADSAAINVLLLGFCQELGIRSVLTTEVINWCRSCVREIALARRLVHHAWTHHVLPKRLEPDLILLRDPRLREHGEQGLRELAEQIRDRNFRIFAERGEIHIISSKMWLRGTDPLELFQQLQAIDPVDPSHAFYLGYELAKAVTALTLGKNYVQDQALRWGFLTIPEKSHQNRITTGSPASSSVPPGEPKKMD